MGAGSGEFNRMAAIEVLSVMGRFGASSHATGSVNRPHTADTVPQGLATCHWTMIGLIADQIGRLWWHSRSAAMAAAMAIYGHELGLSLPLDMTNLKCSRDASAGREDFILGLSNSAGGRYYVVGDSQTRTSIESFGQRRTRDG